MHKFIDARDSDECTVEEWDRDLSDSEGWVGCDIGGVIFIMAHYHNGGYSFNAVDPTVVDSRFNATDATSCIERAMASGATVFSFESLQELAEHLE